MEMVVQVNVRSRLDTHVLLLLELLNQFVLRLVVMVFFKVLNNAILEAQMKPLEHMSQDALLHVSSNLDFTAHQATV